MKVIPVCHFRYFAIVLVANYAALAAVAPRLAAADPPVAAPPGQARVELAKVEELMLQELNDQAGKAYDTACANLKQGYAQALAKARAEVEKTGNLDQALVFKAEEEQLSAGQLPPPSDAADTPPSLKKLRATLRQAWIVQEKERDRKAAPVYAKWDKFYDAFERRTVKAGQLEDAKAIRARRLEIAKDKPFTPASGYIAAAGGAREIPKLPDTAAPVPKGKAGRWKTDREFVLWAVEHGGKYFGLSGSFGEGVGWTPGKELPKEEFRVNIIDIKLEGGITAADLAAMRDLTKLRRIALRGPGTLTGEMGKAISTWPSLHELELTGMELTLDAMPALEKSTVSELILQKVTGPISQALVQLPRGLKKLGLDSMEWQDGLGLLKANKHLRSLVLTAVKSLRIEDFAGLAETGVTSLHLVDLSHLKGAWVQFKPLPKLTSLHLQGKFSAEDAAAIVKAVPALKYANYVGENPEAAAAFAGAPALENAYFQNLKGPGDSLGGLARCPKLRTLRIWYAANESTLLFLGSLLQVEYLELVGCVQLTPEVSRQVAKMPRLTGLRYSTTATDEALGPLNTMTKLEKLDLDNCKALTESAVAALRKALKRCEVKWKKE